MCLVLHASLMHILVHFCLVVIFVCYFFFCNLLSAMCVCV